MVASELTIYNAANISSLATKNSGFIATTLRINNGYFLTPYILLENHIERSLLQAKTLKIRKEVNPSFCFAVLILSHQKTSKWLTVFEIAL